MSYTMQASEQANLDRINKEKQKTELPTPMEPLIVGLIKSFINDSDLSSKLGSLYEARTAECCAAYIESGRKLGGRSPRAKFVERNYDQGEQ